MVLILVASSTVFGHFIALTEISQLTAEWVATLHIPKALILVNIFLIYLIGGSFMDDLAFMILATPIFFPIITGLGYDPIWAGIMIGLTVCIGSVIPPVAMCVFIVKNITKTSFKVIYSGVYPFLISIIIVIVLLFIFPGIATYLPSILMK
jgi:TRAP-type C4-dicarboxylate transport system permease large subunit